MNNLKFSSTQKQQLPDFKLPEPYCHDVWPIKSWPYYKNSDEKGIAQWNVNGYTNTDDLDFSICRNEYIREEIKFFLYDLIEIKKVKLYSLTKYWKQIRTFIRYSNVSLDDYTSISELDSLDDFEDFIQNKDKRKKQPVVKAGTKINAVDMEKTKKETKSPYLKIVKRMQDLVIDFYDDRPIFEKDVWELNKLPMNIDIPASIQISALHFEAIPQTKIKRIIKKYTMERLNSVSLGSIIQDIIYLNTFCTWLNDSHNEVTSLDLLSRNIIEDYIQYLRVDADISSCVFSKRLSCLSTFLDFCRIFRIPDTPKIPLLDKDDYSVKIQYEKTPYSDDEMQRIVENLKYLENQQHARMVFCLIEIGCRISELCTLKPNSLIKKKDSYSLMINSKKNDNPYVLPISDVLGQVLEKAISVSKKLFGDDVVYMFASSITKYITRRVLDNNLKKLSVEHQILDDSGKVLHITFHRFRTTKVSKYLQKGLDADVVSLLVGHKVKYTLKHYAKATNKELVEALQPLMDKYTALIENAGNVSAIKTLSADSSPLPNGRCNKAADTGICDHANHCLSCAMFVPQKEYLYVYEKELSDVETAIAVAEANNNQRLLEYNQQLKEQLEVIIQKCRGETNEI